MSVIQRTVEQVMRQHVGALEQALEKLLVGEPVIRLEELTRVEMGALPHGTIQRSAIRHDGTGSILFAVETVMDGEGFKTRGWVPEGGKLPWS